MGGDLSPNKKYLRILFESCDDSWFTPNEAYGLSCKTKAQINEWIKDKHIVTLTNEQSFNEVNYEEPITKVSKVARFQLFRDQKIEYPIYI